MHTQKSCFWGCGRTPEGQQLPEHPPNGKVASFYINRAMIYINWQGHGDLSGALFGGFLLFSGTPVIMLPLPFFSEHLEGNYISLLSFLLFIYLFSKSGSSGNLALKLKYWEHVVKSHKAMASLEQNTDFYLKIPKIWAVITAKYWQISRIWRNGHQLKITWTQSLK